MRQFLLALGLALLIAAPSGAADLQAVLAAPRQRVESADFRAFGRLIRVDSKGVRTVLPITIEAHGFSGILRVLIQTGKPQQLHILLEMPTHGQNTILIAHPSDKAAVTLPFEQWSDGPLGSGFSYEDFLEQQYFWPGQSLLEESTRGTHLCDVLKSWPGPTERSHYAEIHTWLDRKVGFPLYVEKTLKTSGTVKEFTYLGLRREGGIWSAKQVEEKTRGQSGSTLLIIDRGNTKANLKLRDFDPENLTHFQD